MLVNFINSVSFLLRNFASLYESPCILLFSGLMGLLSLCLSILALSAGALGFMCVMYLCRCLLTGLLHVCNTCCTCL
jgi:hypothetical protein